MSPLFKKQRYGHITENNSQLRKNELTLDKLESVSKAYERKQDKVFMEYIAPKLTSYQFQTLPPLGKTQEGFLQRTLPVEEDEQITPKMAKSRYDKRTDLLSVDLPRTETT